MSQIELSSKVGWKKIVLDSSQERVYMMSRSEVQSFNVTSQSVENRLELPKVQDLAYSAELDELSVLFARGENSCVLKLDAKNKWQVRELFAFAKKLQSVFYLRDAHAQKELLLAQQESNRFLLVDRTRHEKLRSRLVLQPESAMAEEPKPEEDTGLEDEFDKLYSQFIDKW